MRLLVIGGTGNLSLPFVSAAVGSGHDVIALTRGERRPADPVHGVEWVRGDKGDPATLAGLAARGLDAVVTFLAFDADDVRRDLAAFAGRTSQYVLISSASVYLKPPPSHVVTEHTPLGNPYWDYARAKIAAEAALRDAGSVPFTIVRPSYTYGQTWVPTTSGTDYTVVWRMRRGLEVVVPGDGTSLWTLTHATDLARGVLGLLGNPAAIGEAFHVTSDEVLSWNQVHETIARVIGIEPRLVHVPTDVIARIDPGRGASLLGDKAWSTVFDNTKVKRAVPGFEARTRFETGVRASITWLEADPARQRIDANETVERILAAWKRAMSALDSI